MIIPHAIRSLMTAATFSSTHLETKRLDAHLTPRSIDAAYASVATSAIAAMEKTWSADSLQWAGIGGWTAANVYNDIMDFDLWSHTKKYEQTYGAALLTIATSPAAQAKVLSTDGFNDDQLWWCLAMIRAYQNYGHVELLNQSIKQWRAIGANAQVFKADQGTKVTKGGIVRDAAIPKSCDVDGAVYWSSDPSSGLNAISTSLYAQVGAWLFALTGDTSFRGPSDAALGWLQRMMLDKTGIMNIDSLSPGTCTKNLGSLTYNTGVYIGALTSLYLSTSDEKKYLTPLTLSVTSSVTGAFGNTPPLVIGQQSDLIRPSDAVQWRDVLFRNLADYSVGVGNKGGVSAQTHGQVKEFFGRNYNQIQGNARFGELYSANWFGEVKEGSDWGTGSVLGNFVGSMLVGL